MAADLPGTGIRLLHIGPHKTGATPVQGALHLARERLAARGVVYPGRGRALPLLGPPCVPRPSRVSMAA
jgi:hypothetical protein